MEIFPAFLLTLHSQTNFDYDSKKQRQCINGLCLALCINRYLVIERERERGGALFLEMEILSYCLLAPHPPHKLYFVLKH